jgi:hypothetical protein
MSQNGRREFLTSAGAVAAALAACAAPVRRAQAAPCGSIYDEAGIVSKVAPLVHDIAFQNNLLTFPADNLQPTMNDINQNKSLVDDTWQTLKHHQITTVKVVRQINGTPATPAPDTYTLIPSTTTPGTLTRWPVVLTLEQQQTGSFVPDWNQILLFVIPHPRDYQGQPTITGDAKAEMCVHPFGM